MNGVEAVERISVNCFRSFAAIPGSEVIDDGKLCGVMTPVPITFFSGIAMTDLDADEVVGVIDRFRARQCWFRWWLTPSTRPRELAPILAANGMRHAYDAPGMVADLATAPIDIPWPANVTIRRARNVSELQPWADVFIAAFSRPESENQVWRDSFDHCGFGDDAAWTHFTAFLDDKPVATTSVMIESELVGVYHVATIAEARGRGIGAAITAEAMRFARERGARQAALQASELGFGVYRSLGFVEQCQLSLYDWRP